jgi:lysozyme family protein
MTATIPAQVRRMIDDIIAVEGGYVNDPRDAGGETNFGITVATARAYGYAGAMRDLPRELAFEIYLQDYYRGPHFDWIAQRDKRLAEELTDTGVNMGQVWGVKFMQRALNAFNNRGKLYPDIVADGYIGRRTLDALDAFIEQRGPHGLQVLRAACDHLQAARYIELAEAREKNEAFVYGWIDNRTEVPA